MSTTDNKKKNKKLSQPSKNTGTNNAWLSKEVKVQPQQQLNNKKDLGEHANNGAKKFKQVQLEHLQAAKKHIRDYESSSEEEEEIECDTLIASVFKEYAGEKNQLRKTQEFLENIFQSGAVTCLICIATVKRSDYVSSVFEINVVLHQRKSNQN